MRQRADAVDRTRQRITEATVRLHTTIGPAQASLSRIAEEAGVTRVTLYRHFPDLDGLYEACLSHWEATHPGPDPSGWLAEQRLVPRMRLALTDLYAWYRRNGGDLHPIHRDYDVMPASIRERMSGQIEALVDVLVGDAGVRGAARTRLRAAARHVVAVPTWESLAVAGALSDAEAVELALSMFRAAVPASATARGAVTRSAAAARS